MWTIYGGHFDIPQVKSHVKELEKETEKPDFWNDRSKAEDLLKEINESKELIRQIEELKTELESNLEMITLLETEEDEDLTTPLPSFTQRTENAYFLFSTFRLAASS